MNIEGGEDARGWISLCACMLSHFSRFWLSVAPWNTARQAPLFMGFSSQEYWSGCNFLFLGIVPTQWSNPRLPHLLHCRSLFTARPPRISLYLFSKDALGPGTHSKDVTRQPCKAGGAGAAVWQSVHTTPWASVFTAAEWGGRCRLYLISFSSSTFYNLCALERFTQNFILFLLLVVHLPLTEPAAACAEVSGSLFQDNLRGVDNRKHLPHVLSQPRPKACPSQSQPWGLSTVWQLLSSHSVVSNSLRSHWLQHARLPCPSPSPGAYSNSCPLSRWCHPTNFILCCPLLLLPSIFPSIRVFSNESGLFQWVGSLHQVAKVLELWL